MTVTHIAGLLDAPSFSRALCRQALNLTLGFGSLHSTQKEVEEHGDDGGSHCERHVAAVVSLGPWLVSSRSFYDVAHLIV